MLKIFKAASGVFKIAKTIRKPMRDGHELKTAIDAAIERTAIAAEDGKITDAEIEKVGLAWIKVAQEGYDLVPLVRRILRLIT